MAGGYRTPYGDDFGRLGAELDRIDRRLSTLESPTGTSLGSLVAQVQAALADIHTTVTDAINDLSYTAVEIDAKIASPGTIAPADVNASGAVSGTSGTFHAGLVSQDVYNHQLINGPRKSVWVDEAGNLGWA